MLVLTRKPGERVVIQVPERREPIVVQVAAIVDEGRRVRLGFEARADVRIDREELTDARRD